MRQFGRYGPLVAAIEQPTHAARFTVFAAKTSEMLTYHQIPIETYNPKDGWVEQDPMEIMNSILECIEVTLDNLQKLEINPEDIVSIGIANQRETVIVWDSKTGLPLDNAIVWMDTRASSIVEKLCEIGSKTKEAIQATCGLPISTYFTAPKLNWLLKNNDLVKLALTNGTCKVGTVDSWIIWNLTGGNKGGVHVTDVTNASRTMLMNIVSQKWDSHLCDFFQIPMKILPKIKSCSEIYGYIFTGFFTGIPISGCLGDQQAALVGQMCLEFGQTKCTFGSGSFLLCNTGKSLIRSNNGLLTTVAFKFGPNSPAHYALEGSGMIAGLALDWLKNGLEINENSEGLLNGNGIDKTDSLSESLNSGLFKKLTNNMEVQDPDEEGAVYFVPAFSGLYAPYWEEDARGVICGISSNTRYSQLVNSASKALAFQTRAVLESLNKDCGFCINSLLVDGPLAYNSSLMQIQADICGIPMVRPVMAEYSALGAAIAAGSASGVNVWPLASLPVPSDTFNPTTNCDERDIMYNRWTAAIEKCHGWTSSKLPKYQTENICDTSENRLYASIPSGLFILSSYLLLLLADRFKF